MAVGTLEQRHIKLKSRRTEHSPTYHICIYSIEIYFHIISQYQISNINIKISYSIYLFLSNIR